MRSNRRYVAWLLVGLALAGFPGARSAHADPARAKDPPPPAPTEERVSSRQVAGSLLAMVALAAAGTGLYFTARVDQLSRDIEQAKSLESLIPSEQIDRKVKAGERAQTWQWIGYGTAVAAGVGAALLLLWPERGEEAASASLLVTPAVAGASVRLAF